MFKFLHYLVNFPITVNHPYGSTVEDVAKLILSCNDWIVSATDYHLELENPTYKIWFWNTNKLYAWMKEGSIVNKATGAEYVWNGIRPKRITLVRVNDWISSFSPFYREDIVDYRAREELDKVIVKGVVKTPKDKYRLLRPIPFQVKKSWWKISRKDWWSRFGGDDH